MTKNSFRPRGGGGAQGTLGVGAGAPKPPTGDEGGGNILGGLGSGGGLTLPGPNLMGLPALSGGGGATTASGIMPPLQKPPEGAPGVMPPLGAPPAPSLTGGSAQDQVNAAFNPPQFDVNQSGIPGLQGLAGGGVLRQKGVPQIPSL